MLGFVAHRGRSAFPSAIIPTCVRFNVCRKLDLVISKENMDTIWDYFTVDRVTDLGWGTEEGGLVLRIERHRDGGIG